MRNEYRNEHIIVWVPPAGTVRSSARDARLELVIADGEIPEGVPVHLKLDTGMGRYGLSELPPPPAKWSG